jgi:hypothetical protein
MSITRRQFAGAAAGGALLAPGEASTVKAAFRKRSHPLEGIPRENLKITDVRVTLMSYELRDKA